MNILRILSRMREKRFQRKYVYLFYYANGCKFVPKAIAKHIRNSNKKELINCQDIQIESYDYSAQVVHPDIVKRNDKLFFVCTPYPYSIETYENPCVYSGNSVYDLKPINNNPIAWQEFMKQGNHISDPCISEINGILYVFFRDTINLEGKITQKLYVTSSIDGSAWNDKRLILQSNNQSYISPAVISDNDNVVLYYVQLKSEYGGDITKVNLTKSLTYIDECVIKCKNIPSDMIIWHISVVYKKDYSKALDNNQQLIGVFTLRDKATGSHYTNFWAHCDSVNSDWVIDEQLVIPDEINKDISIVYKSAIMPVTGDVILSFRDNNFRWRLVLIPGDRDRQNNQSVKELIDSYRVFSRVFHSSMSYERFKYKHLSNPELKPGYYIQSNENGKTLGTNCFMGARGCFCGETFEIIQSCDTAVVPEARGKGVFSSLINSAVKRFEEDSRIDLMIGFPNDNSYHGFVKLGWNHIGSYSTLIKILRPFDVLLSKFNINSKHYGDPYIFGKGENSLFPNMILTSHNRCPFDNSDFQIINSDGFLRIQRNEEYFNWKIDGSGLDYRYIVLRNEKLKGYLLYRTNHKGRVFITDWFAEKTSEKEYESIIKLLFNSIIKTGNVIVLPYINEKSIYSSVFHSLGFRNANIKLFHYPISKMIVKPLSKNVKNIGVDFDQWFVSAIDTDTVIQ